MTDQWTIIVNETLAAELEKKLDRIAAAMLEAKYTFAGGDGVGDDEFGAALFFFYYSRFKLHEEALDAGVELIDGIFQRVNRELAEGRLTVSSSYFNTIGWLFEHLEQNDFLDIDTNEILDVLDDFIFQGMMADIQEENYDLVSGALGKALYFMRRMPKKPELSRFIEALIGELNRISQKVPDRGISWRHKIQSQEGDDVFVANMGLAHGIPGVVVFLARCAAMGLGGGIAVPLIDGAVDYIFSHQQDRGRFLSHFPQWIAGDSYASESRLAWCYGDLGVGTALLHTGRLMNRDSWREQANIILKDTAKRDNLRQNAVQDAGLCHGTAGIGHMFNRLYQLEGITDYKTAAEFWFTKTLEMASFPDGFAGFKAFKGEGEWQAKWDLHIGVSGIGLAIMSAIGALEPAWDEIMLLS